VCERINPRGRPKKVFRYCIQSGLFPRKGSSGRNNPDREISQSQGEAMKISRTKNRLRASAIVARAAVRLNSGINHAIRRLQSVDLLSWSAFGRG
jgi:hypothetical protein